MMPLLRLKSLLILFVFAAVAPAWQSDNGDGTYTNPPLYADFLDPDIIRVGEDFYFATTTFANSPGLTVLHSKDLVHWEYQGQYDSVMTFPAESITTIHLWDYQVDILPPSPQQASFAVEPLAVGSTEIVMTAAAGSDDSGPVEYYFTCTYGSGNDSGWQSSITYTDTGLLPDNQYAYTVTMRDSSPMQNEGIASEPVIVTTFTSGEFMESNGIISMEAENGKLGSRWITGNALYASNDKYIEIDPSYNNVGYSPECVTDDCIAAYQFDVVTGGNYGFWFRTCSDNAGDDSFFWQIDNKGWNYENNRFGIGSWFSSNNSQVDSLDAGTHILEIAYRENGTCLDKFIIQLDSIDDPEGDSSAESSQNFGDQLTKCEQVQYMGYRLASDFDGNCKINITDFVLIAEQWLSDSPVNESLYYSSDIVEDDLIDMSDLTVMAFQWLMCNDPEIFGCEMNWQ